MFAKQLNTDTGSILPEMFSLLLKPGCCLEVKESCMKVVDDLMNKSLEQEEEQDVEMESEGDLDKGIVKEVDDVVTAIDVGKTVLPLISQPGMSFILYILYYNTYIYIIFSILYLVIIVCIIYIRKYNCYKNINLYNG